MMKSLIAALLLAMMVAGPVQASDPEQVAAEDRLVDSLATTAQDRLDESFAALGDPATFQTPDGLPNVPTLASSTTQCHLVPLLICATAVADPAVLCTRPAPLTVSCVGGSGVGGHGVSPAGLSGSNSWSASSFCWDECSDFKSAGGFCTWALLSAAGCGSGTALNHPIRTEFSLFRTCVNYGTDAFTSDTASAVVVVTLASVSTSASGSAHNSLCNF